MESWWDDLKDYANNKKNISEWRDFATFKDFPMLLADFLFSSEGTKYQSNFKWEGILACNVPAPNILVRCISIVTHSIPNRDVLT